MIRKTSRSALCCASLLLLASALSAAPRLSVSQSSFTVSVVPGSNGTTEIVDALNLGDGQLSLQASSSAPWLVPTVGALGLCGLRGKCIPIQIALQTSSLAKGAYTATVSLSDPNAIDAPQNITINVAVGGNVPDKLEFYLAPGNSVSSSFSTGGVVKAAVSNNTPWLTFAVNAGGILKFNTLTAKAASSMTAGDYNGSVTISGSSFAPDNKTISVLIHVTAEPILQTSSNAVSFAIAQGANKQTAGVAVANGGQGTLTVSSVTAKPASGTWLTAQTTTGGFSITADPAALAPNTYTGTVTIASNAANSSVDIPVQLVVEAQTPPVAFPGGMLNNGTFGFAEPLAQGDIVAMFGDQFTYGDPQAAQNFPLQTTLGDVQVLVDGKAAPLFYVSPGQINFEIPIDATTGLKTVQVVHKGQNGNLASLTIASRVPRFILLNGGPYAIMTTPDNVLTGIPSHPVKAGDTIVIYAIGLGPTSPPVDSGTASPGKPLATVSGTSQVCFGAVTPFYKPPCATPFFVGLTPNFVGLYQLNVTVPKNVKSSDNTMFIFLVDNISSTGVALAIQ